MRVGNTHEPQAGVDVTKIPTGGQTQALRRNGDTSLFCASRTWTMTGEMQKKLQTTQRRMTKDDQTDEEQINKKSSSRTRHECQQSRRRTTRPRLRTEGRHDRDQPTRPQRAMLKRGITSLSSLNTSKIKTLTATTPSTARHKTSWKTNWIHGLTNPQGRRPVGSRWNHVVDPQTWHDTYGNKQK